MLLFIPPHLHQTEAQVVQVYLLQMLKYRGEQVLELWPGTAQMKLIYHCGSCRVWKCCCQRPLPAHIFEVVHIPQMYQLGTHALSSPENFNYTNSVPMTVTDYCLVFCRERSHISAHLCLSVTVH